MIIDKWFVSKYICTFSDGGGDTGESTGDTTGPGVPGYGDSGDSGQGAGSDVPGQTQAEIDFGGAPPHPDVGGYSGEGGGDTGGESPPTQAEIDFGGGPAHPDVSGYFSEGGGNFEAPKQPSKEETVWKSFEESKVVPSKPTTPTIAPTTSTFKPEPAKPLIPISQMTPEIKQLTPDEQRALGYRVPSPNELQAYVEALGKGIVDPETGGRSVPLHGQAALAQALKDSETNWTGFVKEANANMAANSSMIVNALHDYYVKYGKSAEGKPALALADKGYFAAARSLGWFDPADAARMAKAALTPENKAEQYHFASKEARNFALELMRQYPDTWDKELNKYVDTVWTGKDPVWMSLYANTKGEERGAPHQIFITDPLEVMPFIVYDGMGREHYVYRDVNSAAGELLVDTWDGNQGVTVSWSEFMDRGAAGGGTWTEEDKAEVIAQANKALADQLEALKAAAIATDAEMQMLILQDANYDPVYFSFLEQRKLEQERAREQGLFFIPSPVSAMGEITVEKVSGNTPDGGDGYKFTGINERGQITEYYVPKNYMVSVGNQLKIKYWEGDNMRIESGCTASSCQTNMANVNSAVEKIRNNQFGVTPPEFAPFVENKIPEVKVIEPPVDNTIPEIPLPSELPKPPVVIPEDNGELIYMDTPIFTKLKSTIDEMIAKGIIEVKGVFAGLTKLGNPVFVDLNNEAFNLSTSAKETITNQGLRSYMDKAQIVTEAEFNRVKDKVDKYFITRDENGQELYNFELYLSDETERNNQPDAISTLKKLGIKQEGIDKLMTYVPKANELTDKQYQDLSMRFASSLPPEQYNGWTQASWKNYLKDHADDLRVKYGVMTYNEAKLIDPDATKFIQQMEVLERVLPFRLEQLAKDIGDNLKSIELSQLDKMALTQLLMPAMTGGIINFLTLVAPKEMAEAEGQIVSILNTVRDTRGKFWTEADLDKWLAEAYQKDVQMFVDGGMSREIAEKAVSLSPREANLNALHMAYDMLGSMLVDIPITVMSASASAIKGDVSKAAMDMAMLTGGLVLFPSIYSGQLGKQVAKGQYAKSIGQLATLGLTMVISPAHMVKGAAKAITFLGDITIRNGKIFIPKALKLGSSGLSYLDVPKGYYKLITELDHVFADKATVEKIMRMDKAVDQEQHVLSLLSAESRPVWEATKQMTELAHKNGELPTSWRTDKLDFSIIKDFPAEASEAVRAVFKSFSNDGYFKGSFADISQIKDSTLKALITEQYGRIGDGDYVSTAGKSAMEKAKLVADAINKASGENIASVTGRADNAKVMLKGGKAGGIFQIHTGRIGIPKPFGWEKQFTFVTVDGIKMANFKDQLFRRGDIILYPGSEAMAGTFGIKAETATTGTETAAVARRSLKDWYRLKYQVELIIENMKAEGKTDIASQLQEYLQIAENGVKKPFKEGGTVEPLEITGEKPLVLTSEAKQDILSIFNVLQEVAVAEGRDTYFLTPDGVIFRFTSPSEKILKDTLFHVTDDIRPYQELAKQGKVLKPGYVLDANGSYIPAPADTIFLSPQAALAYLDKAKNPNSGIVAVRATGADRINYLEPAFRTEPFEEAKYATVDIFGKKVNIGDKKIVDKIFDEWVWGKEKGGEALPLGEEYAARGAEGIDKYPILWFAMKDALSKGLGIPDVATVKAINSLAWKQAIKDALYPKLNKRIQVIFDPTATGKGGWPIQSGKESWIYKELTQNEKIKVFGEEVNKISATGLTKLNNELKALSNKDTKGIKEFITDSAEALKGGTNAIKEFVENNVKVVDGITNKILQTTLDDLNTIINLSKNEKTRQAFTDLQRSIDRQITDIRNSVSKDAYNVSIALKEIQGQILKLKEVQLGKEANKVLNKLASTIDDKVIKLNEINNLGSKSIYVFPEDVREFALPEDYYRVINNNNKGAVLNEIRSGLSEESRQVWDSLFQLTTNLYKSAIRLNIKDVPTIDIKAMFGDRFTTESAAKIKSVMQKFKDEGYATGSFGDGLQMADVKLPDFMKPNDIDVHLWKESKVTASEYTREILDALKERNDKETIEKFTDEETGNEFTVTIVRDSSGLQWFSKVDRPDGSSTILDWRFADEPVAIYDVMPTQLFKHDMLLKEWTGMKAYREIDGIMVADIRNQILDRGTILLTPASEYIPAGIAAKVFEARKMSGTFGQMSKTALTGEPTGVKIARGLKDWNRYEFEARYFIDQMEKAGNRELAKALRDRLEIAKEGVKTTLSAGGTLGGLVDELGFLTGTPAMWKGVSKVSKKLMDAAKLKKMIEDERGTITNDYLINLADLSRQYYRTLSPTVRESATPIGFTIIPSNINTVEGIRSTLSPTVTTPVAGYGATLPVTTTTKGTTPITAPVTPTIPPTIPTIPTTKPTPTAIPVTTITTTPLTPTTPITIPIPIPLTPPARKTTTIILKQVASIDDLTSEQKEASVAWKQGWAYHLIYPPWNAQNILHSKEPFPGVKIHRGIGSAKKSLAQVHGAELPDKIFWDLGIVDITFSRGNKGQVGMEYKSDPKDINKRRGAVGMPKSTTVRVSAIAPRIGGTR